MMMLALFPLVLCMGLAQANVLNNVRADVPPEDSLPCKSYDRYCEGTKFEEKMDVKNRIVSCNVMPDPKRQCCLPQAKHMVCYDMMVDGNSLNFDSTNQLDTTDYGALCKVMLEQVGKVADSYATAYKEDGGGNLSYKYGKFDIVAASGSEHIQHLACSYQ